MKRLAFSFALVTGAAYGLAAEPMDNPAIDVDGYLRAATEAAKHRATCRLSEDAFIRMSRQPGVVVLDARSKAKYDELHIQGAINLSFPDMAIASLQKHLPDQNAPILIYCNNNFLGAEDAFPAKLPAKSLNLSTYVTLYSYGYRNVYELAPLIDIGKSKLTFVRGENATVTRPASARVARP